MIFADFDFALNKWTKEKIEQKIYYVEGFLGRDSIEERHSDAKAGSEILEIHDRFAFARVMEMTLKNSKKLKAVLKLICAQECNYEEVAKMLGALKVPAKPEVNEVARYTSSPNRPKGPIEMKRSIGPLTLGNQ